MDVESDEAPAFRLDVTLCDGDAVGPALFQPAHLPDAQFIPKCLLRCDIGTIRTMPQPRTQLYCDVDFCPFQNLKHHLELLSSVDDIKYQSLLFFCWLQRR